MGGYVSSDDHQVSLAQGWVCFQCWPPDVTSKGGGYVQRGFMSRGIGVCPEGVGVCLGLGVLWDLGYTPHGADT